MKNNISDLADMLFEQMDRLQDDTGELELQKEIGRASAMADLADKILDIGRLQLEAQKVAENWNIPAHELPVLIENKTGIGERKCATANTQTK